MFKVIGKAHYSVNYEGKTYDKIRYTLELTDLPKSIKDREGVIADTVCVKQNDFNDLPQIGDSVNVSYNRFGKPDVIIVV